MRLLFHIFFILLVNFSLAQDPYNIHLHKMNGLPSNSVYNIFQDKKGFVWIANNAGLTRYDGFEFKTHTSTSQTSKSGTCIMEDEAGRVWYENFDGFIYYVEGDSLKSLKQNAPIGYIPYGITHKHLFVIQKKGIDVFDIATLKFLKTIFINFETAEHAISVNNQFYALIESTIYCITEKLEVITNRYDSKEAHFAKQIYGFENGIYILNKYNTGRKINLYDAKLNFINTFSIKEPTFIQGSNFIDSLLWIHTTTGTYAYSMYLPAKPSVSFFKEKSISSLLKDRQDNYWFGTTNEGIYVVPNLKNTVINLKDFSPTKIVEINEGYCIATKKGELVFCDKNFNIQHIVRDTCDRSDIYMLEYDSLNKKFLYTSNNFTERHSDNKFSLAKTHRIAIKDMVRIDSNYYAFAASGCCGLALFDPKKSNSKWDKLYKTSLATSDVNTCNILPKVRGKSVVHLKKSDALYFATNVGFYKITPDKKSEIKYNGNSFYINRLTIFNDSIYALDSKGNLFLIHKDSIIECLNSKLGLNDDEIKYIKNQGSKLVVVSKEKCQLVDLVSFYKTRIDIDIKSYEISDVLINRDYLLFVTSNGLIKTSLFSTNSESTASFIVDEFRINNVLHSFEGVQNLSHKQNDIIIKYSIIDFTSGPKSEVSYRINSGDWKTVSRETRTIEFASLASGNYAIEFKLNGKICVQKILFSISAPFWQTTWFTIISGLLTIISVFFYFKWQLNKLKLKNKLLQDKIQLEYDLNRTVLKSIKAQMNPHFFYNALNTIQAYIFTNDKAKASTYLAKFSKLTRAILEMSERERISLNEEIQSLTLYLELEKMRFKNDFEYEIMTTNVDNSEIIEFPPMIIQPYVENAVKHGLLHMETSKLLTITFAKISSILQIVIEDNGIGRKRSAELNKIKTEKYKSFSTKANEKRLEILNKNSEKNIGVEYIDKFDSAGNANGTKVILSIPI